MQVNIGNDKKRGEIHFAFAMYILGVLITPASILRTIPVAFIYKLISLLYKFVLLVSVKQGDLW